MAPTNPGVSNTIGVPDHTQLTSEVNQAFVQITLAYVAVGLRTFARYKSEMKFGADDWCIIASAIAILPFGIATWVSDQHKGDVDDPAHFVQKFLILVISYSVSTPLAKISILCFYYRIFSKKMLKRIAYGVGIFTVLYTIPTPVIACVMCTPISSTHIGKGKCGKVYLPFVVLGTINFVTDVVVLAIPVYSIRQIHTTLFKKFQIAGIFLTGALVCVFGILRVVAHIHAQRSLKTGVNYPQGLPAIWSLWEASIGIVVACLPTLGFYFAQSLKLNKDGKIRVCLSRWRSKILPRSCSNKNPQASSSKNYLQREDDPFYGRSSGPTTTIKKTIDFTVSSFPMDRELDSIDNMTISTFHYDTAMNEKTVAEP